MRRFGTVVALTLAILAMALPAFARESFVNDQAGLLSPQTVANLNQRIGDFNRQTGKEVVVDIVPSLDGQSPQTAAEHAFAQNQVNGVMIFVAKSPKTIGVVPDRAASRYFPPGTTNDIRNAIRADFNSGNYDQGITTGVNLILDQYRSHAGALAGGRRNAVRNAAPVTSHQSTGGFHLNMLWLILILIAGFLIIRAIFRAFAGPRMYPPGYGGRPGYPPGPGYPPQGGYGGPGYGPGYGYGGGGGGGGFFSGLLGGLGGAFLGNELFGGRRETIIEEPNQAGMVGGGYDQGSAAGGGDASGFQSDAGQADMSNASFGDWGGGGGGGFDGGGGGGFDSGSSSGGDSGGW